MAVKFIHVMIMAVTGPHCLSSLLVGPTGLPILLPYLHNPDQPWLMFPSSFLTKSTVAAAAAPLTAAAAVSAADCACSFVSLAALAASASNASLSSVSCLRASAFGHRPSFRGKTSLLLEGRAL